MDESLSALSLQLRVTQSVGDTRAMRDAPQDIATAARQFEAMLVKVMIDASYGDDDNADPDDALLDNDGVRAYRDMLSQSLASEVSRHTKLGLADAMQRQLGGADTAAARAPQAAKD